MNAVAEMSDGTAITVDVAWLVGALIGDGTVSERHVRLCMFGEDREKAIAIMCETWGGNPSVNSSSGIVDGNKRAAEALRDLGLTLRGASKRIPEAVWTWSSELQRAVLDGYCDADGHRPANPTKHGERTYHSSSRELIEDVRSMHIMLGDPVSNITTTRRTKPIVIKGKRVRSALDLHAVTLWPGIGRGETALRANAGIRDWLNSRADFSLARVLEISNSGTQESYGVDLEDSDNFVAEGVLARNHP